MPDERRQFLRADIPVDSSLSRRTGAATARCSWRAFVGLGEAGRRTRQRVAPFFLATAPLGPVQLSLTGAYVLLRTHTDYTGAPIDSDKGRVNARVLSLDAGWWASDRWRLGGGVSWTDIPAQRVQADALPLDSAWGHASAGVTYRLTDQLDASLRGGHDFANARGDGFRLGAGLGYRF